VTVRTVRVAFSRLHGWLGRFDARHPGCAWSWVADGVSGVCPDGSTLTVPLPYGGGSAADPSDDPRDALIAYASRPWRIGLLVVRRGGFAVARVAGTRVEQCKVGRRHVQGRTKAGGWSQQRFARRRDNQARQAFDAAADHAVEILGTAHLDALGIGGDRSALARVLGDPRLAYLAGVPRIPLGSVGDPTTRTLDSLVETMCSVRITIEDATVEEPPDAGAGDG
jgi:hypothetical protein